MRHKFQEMWGASSLFPRHSVATACARGASEHSRGLSSSSEKAMSRALSQARLASASRRVFLNLRPVPLHIPRPQYADGSAPPNVNTAPYAVYDMDSQALKDLRKACALAR